MKTKKKIVYGILLILIFLLCGGLLTSCRKNREEESDYYIYYLNQEKTKIVRTAYEPSASKTEDLIEEYIEKISEETNSVDYRKVFPNQVSIERYEYKDHQLYLYFNKAYLEMPASEEVLCRGAIVHTMMQVKEVSGVSFYADNLPLLDANGDEIGIMTGDTFVENPGEKINNIQEGDFTLYFANEEGDGLVSESQHVYYSGNISPEKKVMELILEGPESKNARRAVPEGTGLISVSVMDGVCFVNLDENFLVQDFNIQEDVVIYSIVNSLTELQNVNTVQLSVKGETNMNYREKMSLSEYYKKNLDLIKESGARVEKQDTAIDAAEEGEAVIEIKE